MIFTPSVINHTQPQISVNASDAGSGNATPITYGQIKASLGNQIYNVNSLYIESTNVNQITGTINFQRFDITGNQEYRTITPIIDPFQKSKSLILKLEDKFFILNGNSSFNSVVLPNTKVKTTLYSDRITNNFGMQVNNFQIMAEIFKKKDFFKDYGDIESIEKSNKKVLNELSNKPEKKKIELPKESTNGYFYFDSNAKKTDNISKIYYVFSAIVISAGIWYLIKNRKK